MATTTTTTTPPSEGWDGEAGTWVDAGDAPPRGMEVEAPRGESESPTTRRASLASLARSLGRGISNDLEARLNFYAEDWREATKDGGRAFTRIIAAATYVFFASALPAIAFGEQLRIETKGKMSIHHTLLSTGMCGVIQSVLSGQPLLIVGVSEPIVITYHFMNQYCTKNGINFVAWSAWTCVWACAFLALMSVTNLCNGIKWFTRFCGESFGMLIAILFLQQAIKGLVDEFTYDVTPTYWQTMNGVFGLLLAFLYLWSSYTLSQARRWRFGVTFVRAVLADYGFAIMIVAFSGLAYALKGNPEVPQRIVVPPVRESAWYQSGIYTVEDMAGVGGAQIAAAIVPGFVISVLFYFDHSVSGQLCSQKDFNVKRPSAYHYDLLLLAAMTILCGLLGLPPVNGVLPQAPLHTKSLCSKLKVKKGESSKKGQDQPQFQVYENRWSNLIQAALCLVLFGVADLLLKYIPTALVWAFFAFMALESLPGNQLWDRLQIIVSEPKRRIQWLQGPHCLYLETVKFPSIVIFTLIQFGCVLVIWAITVWTGLFGISFPLWIMALVPLRAFLLPKILRPEHLSDLDAESVVEIGDQNQEHPSGFDASWFPEDHDENAQALLHEYLYGKVSRSPSPHTSPGSPPTPTPTLTLSHSLTLSLSLSLSLARAVLHHLQAPGVAVPCEAGGCGGRGGGGFRSREEALHRCPPPRVAQALPSASTNSAVQDRGGRPGFTAIILLFFNLRFSLDYKLSIFMGLIGVPCPWHDSPPSLRRCQPTGVLQLSPLCLTPCEVKILHPTFT